MKTPVDVDVAIVGAGLAGLTAAVRVRFVKAFEAAPLSVVVLDPGPPGGLLQAGASRILTGPSLLLDTATILDGLRRDVDRLQVPVVPSLVDRLDLDGGRFTLTTREGATFRATSVVLATGSRPLGNELAHLGDRVFITSKGTSFITQQLAAARVVAGALPLAVATRLPSRIHNLLQDLPPSSVLLVPPGDAPSPDLPGRVVPCRSLHVAGREASALLVRTDAGHEVRCGALFLDYLSFQWTPLLPALGVPLDEVRPGLPRLDADLCTSQPGLFLAGDVTCRQASVASALGDGVTAGFGAYRHAFQAQFGRPPLLFAYRAPPPGMDLGRELPDPAPRDRLRWLVDEGQRSGLLADCHGEALETIAATANRPFDEVVEAVLQGMRAKLLTVCRQDDTWADTAAAVAPGASQGERNT